MAALGDFQPLSRGGLGIFGALQAVEAVFGAVDQAGLQEVQPQLIQRMGTGLAVEIGTVDEVLVHANGPVGLAPTPEQRTQRKMQFAGLGLDANHVDEGIDGLVGLLVEQQVHAAKVGIAQRCRLVVQTFLAARGQPAQSEGERNGQQPPVFELHGLSVPSGGRRRKHPAGWHRRRHGRIAPAGGPGHDADA